MHARRTRLPAWATRSSPFRPRFAAERERATAERGRAESLTADLAALHDDHARQKDESAHFADEVLTLSAKVAAANEQVAAHAAKIAALAGERDRLTAELKKHQEASRALNAELFADVRLQEELERRLYETEMALSDAKAEIVSLRIRQQTNTVVGTDQLRQTLATSEADKTTLAARLAALQSDLAALRAENDALRRSSAVADGGQRTDYDDQELRQRLNEIAANVVRLTQAIATGDGAPLVPDGASGNGHGYGAERQPESVSAAATPGEAEPAATESATLAERLRALQHAGARH
jgi:chromosome segregation ATPase